MTRSEVFSSGHTGDLTSSRFISARGLSTLAGARIISARATDLADSRATEAGLIIM
jgi:hypothetical protein